LLSLPFHSFLSYLRPPPSPPLFPYTTLFRSTVTVPNGGESWSIGTTQTITWTKTGTLGSVRLDYSTDGGATYPNVINLSVPATPDRKSTRLNSSHQIISYAVFCLKKKKHSKD